MPTSTGKTAFGVAVSVAASRKSGRRAAHRERLLLAAALLTLLSGTAHAQGGPPRLGEEFQVNTYTTNHQASPAVAMDVAGNFVVVWSGEASHDFYYGILGQRYDAGGQKVGGEFRVNTYTIDAQKEPAVAMDASDNFVVVWRSDDQDGHATGTFGQRYDASGNRVGQEFQVNTYTTGDQHHANVAASASGEFVVVWGEYYFCHDSHDGSSGGVFGQRFDASGTPVGPEFQVNSYTTGSQNYPAVAADPAGNFVVVWSSSGQDGSSGGIFGQRYDAAGNRLGDEFQVNTYRMSNQQRPAIAVDVAGKFVVVWNSFEQDGDNFGIFGQRYDAAGDPVGGEFPVNTYTTGTQLYPEVAADSSGHFVTVWSDYLHDGHLWGTFGRLYDAAGHPVGEQFQVNTYTTGIQFGPEVALDRSGRFVVAFSSEPQDGSDFGVFGQRFLWPIFNDDFESGDTSAWSQVGE